MLKAAGLGQGLAALNALTGILSSALVNKGVSLPATQSLLNYTCLALIYGSCLLISKQGVRKAWWKFACLALSECVATFCMVTSYKHTSLTSATLLNCFAIPCVLVLSQLFLKVKYSASHWLGAFLCLLGLFILVLSDRGTDESSAPNPMLGDGLVIVAAVLYAGNNVAQEKLLGETGKLEVLAMGGVFGMIWGGCLALLLEREKILMTHWTAEVVGLTVGFDAACFAFTSLAPFALIWGGATLFNLSLLASDLWAALARIIFFGGFSTWAAASFIIAFVLVGAGVVIYSLSGDAMYKPEDQNAEGDAEKADQVQASDTDRTDSQEMVDMEAQGLLHEPPNPVSRLKTEQGSHEIQTPPSSNSENWHRTASL